MGRPKKQPGELDTRARILCCAELAFAERGFDGTPLETIARRAGIRRPSLLYHFPTKQALYSAVIEDVFEDLRAAIAEGLSTGADFETRLRALAAGFDRYVDARPQAAQLVLREILDDRGSGRALLLASAVPLLEMVEAFVHSSPDADVDGLSVREALMTLASSRFLRASAGDLAAPLWGPSSSFTALALRLFTHAP